MALCGLLASSDIDDLLVLKIAQKYIKDYTSYCKNTRLYIQRFATRPRPEYQDLIFSKNVSLGSVKVN
jgi:hypothetical protein